MASTSSSVGIASAQASRDATSAPGGVAEAHHALELPARQQPVAERAAERVAGAEAVDDLDRHGRDLDHSSPRRASTPCGPRLTIARSRPARPRARSPPVSHSSRLPTATLTCGSASRTQRRASSRESQNIGR